MSYDLLRSIVQLYEIGSRDTLGSEVVQLFPCVVLTPALSMS